MSESESQKRVYGYIRNMMVGQIVVVDCLAKLRIKSEKVDA